MPTDFNAMYMALANGRSIQARHSSDSETDWTDQWNWTEGAMSAFLNKVESSGWSFRVMPRTISINGVEVPEPLRVAPEEGTTVWLVILPTQSNHRWSGNANDLAWLGYGLLHATEEAARAHAEALLKCSAS